MLRKRQHVKSTHAHRHDRSVAAISYTNSRIPPVENGPFGLDFFRLHSSGPSSYRQSSRFYSFCALPTGGWSEGILLNGSRKSAGSSVSGASRVLREQRVLRVRLCKKWPYIIKNISRTSAVSSTNFGSILIFASCVGGTCNILHG